jgi:hypothetical protein
VIAPNYAEEQGRKKTVVEVSESQLKLCIDDLVLLYLSQCPYFPDTHG